MLGIYTLGGGIGELATMVDENEDLAHRQPVSGRRWLENIEMSG